MQAVSLRAVHSLTMLIALLTILIALVKMALLEATSSSGSTISYVLSQSVLLPHKKATRYLALSAMFWIHRFSPASAAQHIFNLSRTARNALGPALVADYEWVVLSVSVFALISKRMISSPSDRAISSVQSHLGLRVIVASNFYALESISNFFIISVRAALSESPIADLL